MTSDLIRKQTKVRDYIMERTWTMESDTHVFKIFTWMLLTHKMSIIITPASWGFWWNQ